MEQNRMFHHSPEFERYEMRRLTGLSNSQIGGHLSHNSAPKIPICFWLWFLARKVRRAAENKAKCVEYRRRDGVSKKVQAYRKANLPRRREREKQRKKTDPNFKLRVALRSRLNVALNRKRVRRVESALSLIGCTASELRRHLESQFQPGMTWQNHARDGWHIDHITPLEFYDLTKPEERAQAFHWSNVQPLWSMENISKGDRLICA
jgi:hypothetical protein